ncbi:MAG: 4Fe-4S dicluster domain-containing protein [Hoeflea sp.]|nr:4Fe-4S dicluster domain-containing protein [Hoeflea sp.]
MTSLPATTERRLGLVIDLDTCVGCHACAVNCKEWNSGALDSPLSDVDAYGTQASGAWLNRIHTFEVTPADAPAQIVHFPKSCLHCDDAPCVTVCPTGASHKRSEDGIVLVTEDMCIGCGLCAWACPYGAREMDPVENVMKKCTLCVDRIYSETLAEEDRIPACVRTCPSSARHFGDFNDPTSNVSVLVAARGGIELMPEMGTRPVNRYLPPRPKTNPATRTEPARPAASCQPDTPRAEGFLGWLDAALDRLG